MNHYRKTKKKIYNKVENESRLKLVNLVEKNDMKLKDAAKLLHINYSTVKTIMRLYRTENRIYRKKKGGFIKKKARKENKVKSCIKSVHDESYEETIVSSGITTENQMINKEKEVKNEENQLKDEKLINDLYFYYRQKCALLNEIQINNYFIFQMNFLKEIWLIRGQYN